MGLLLGGELHSGVLQCMVDECNRYSEQFLEAGKALENIFVLHSRSGKNWNQLRIAEILLLFQMYGRKEGSNEKHASIRNMECPPFLEKIDEKLGCVSQ